MNIIIAGANPDEPSGGTTPKRPSEKIGGREEGEGERNF